MYARVVNETGCGSWAVSMSIDVGLLSPAMEYRLAWSIQIPRYAGSHVFLVVGHSAAATIVIDETGNVTGLDPVWLEVLLPPPPAGSLEGDTVVLSGQTPTRYREFFLEFANRNYGSGDPALQNQTVGIAYAVQQYERPSLDAVVGMPAGRFILFFSVAAGIALVPGVTLIIRVRRLGRDSREPSDVSQGRNHL